MQQPRRIARELALLSLSQLKAKAEPLNEKDLQALLTAAVQALTLEAKDALETASDELKRGNDRLFHSEVRAPDLQSAHAMVGEAIALAQTAINRLGDALEIPEWVQFMNQADVGDYALKLITTVQKERERIEAILTASMVDWQLHRLPRVDQDILRLAVGEILYLGVPLQVAINEAVELAKRYSDDAGRRFINGVLRRVSNRLKGEDCMPQPAP